MDTVIVLEISKGPEEVTEPSTEPTEEPTEPSVEPTEEPTQEAAEGAGLTLHRCIDVSADLEQTYRDAMALGIDTILTSGGASSCKLGFEQISRLAPDAEAYAAIKEIPNPKSTFLNVFFICFSFLINSYLVL